MKKLVFALGSALCINASNSLALQSEAVSAYANFADALNKIPDNINELNKALIGDIFDKGLKVDVSALGVYSKDVDLIHLTASLKVQFEDFGFTQFQTVGKKFGTSILKTMVEDYIIETASSFAGS